MPFFLVMQTSLVEAEDEQQAAQTGVDRLRSGGQVTVAVKSDETTITRVVVPAVVERSPPASFSEAVNPFPSSVAIPEAGSAAPGNRKVVLKRMMANALAVLHNVTNALKRKRDQN
jgi:hypothetical protein